jgi:Plasmid pRiA4b ORF-3-like protein
MQNSMAKEKPPSKQTEARLPAIHVYKVALKYRKSIWGRIEISSTQTLDDLHWAIFDAFDRDDEHLYAFYLTKPGDRGRQALLNAKQFVHPDALEAFDEQARDASEVQLCVMGLRRGRKFEYEFDFGDSWRHDVTFEGEQPADPEVTYPRVVESKGKSPPQYPDFDEDW